jgi:hypothetical protein
MIIKIFDEKCRGEKLKLLGWWKYQNEKPIASTGLIFAAAFAGA